MTARKAAPKRSPLAKLHFSQAGMGFETKVAVRPLKGGKQLVRSVSAGGECREEMIYDTQVQLKNLVVSTRRKSKSWERIETHTNRLNLDAPETKQPGVTHFYLYGGDWYGDYEGSGPCRRSCCQGKMVQVFDALVGNVGVLFDPDWYRGNWWQTLPEDNFKKKSNGPIKRYADDGNFQYFGVSNFFLRHPALCHTMMGLFRQAFLIFEQGLEEGMFDVLDQKDVVEALSQGDQKLALRNIQRIRPWLEVSVTGVGAGPRSYPFPKGYWSRLLQLHKAIYKHGYENVFDGDLERGWNLLERGYEDCVRGAWDYWGGKAKRGYNAETPDGKRLAQLGK